MYGRLVAMILRFWTISEMVLADASVLIFACPIFSFFLAAFVLGERVGRFDLIVALCCFGGVIHGSVYAPLGGLGAAAAQALAFVFIRKLRTIPSLVVIHYYMFTCAAAAASWVLLTEDGGFKFDLHYDIWMAAISTGVIGFIGQWSLTKGFQLESVGVASVMRYLDIVFVFIWDVTFLKETISPWSYAGAAVILACACTVAWRQAH
ncbi:hypothetical protein AC1031_018855 [Aphanomyces cochlioides]|nr:hypothetical protein AC1031_018855 [Aphanomyces cochlioides]